MGYCIYKSYKLKIPAIDYFKIFSRQKGCFFLDSSLSQHSLGRYSLLGVNPFHILKSDKQNLFQRLRELLQKYRIDHKKSNFPFLGGAVGYLAYDLGKKQSQDPDIPGSFFAFYNCAVVFDHQKKLLHVFSLGLPEKNSACAKKLASENFKKILKLLSLTKSTAIDDFCGPDKSRGLSSNFSKDKYIKAVKKAKEYIRAGDIYQVNLAQIFTARNNSPSRLIYQRLRSISPSSFGAYFDCQDFQIISSSPERFLKLEGDIVTTRPMKGTRPRGNNRLADKKYRRDLLSSAKDKAELMMIVDLERNDLGRVCDYNSIKVESLRNMEKYNTVFQTTASVRGKLHRFKDRIDLLRACFPGGSITGCPKIRAMQIIEELEPSQRGIYTGALGYLSFSGRMDFNILIRTILKKGNLLKFGVGGGIVADSDPEKEYQETLVKAKAMFQAIT